MLCTMFLLAAVVALVRWHEKPDRRRWLIVTGLLLGMAGLTHPFALVGCLQAALVVVISALKWREKLIALLLLTGACLVPLLFWLPLITAHPDLFRHQFFGNVVDRSSGGLLFRLVWPWESLAYHARLLWEHAGLWQFVLMVAGLIGGTLIDVRRRGGPRLILLLAWTSVYLLPVCAGTHPTKGYWSYPGALLMLCLARTLVVAGGALAARISHPRLVAITMGLLVGVLLIPGSGVRATLAHLRHWNDVNYDRTRFVEQMLAQLPRDAKFTVDPAFVYDWYLSGRPTILGVDVTMYFQCSDHDWDYLIASRYALDNDLPRRLGGELVTSFGDRDDPFACYAEVYRNAGLAVSDMGRPFTPTNDVMGREYEVEGNRRGVRDEHGVPASSPELPGVVSH